MSKNDNTVSGWASGSTRISWCLRIFSLIKLKDGLKLIGDRCRKNTRLLSITWNTFWGWGTTSLPIGPTRPQEMQSGPFTLKRVVLSCFSSSCFSLSCARHTSHPVPVIPLMAMTHETSLCEGRGWTERGRRDDERERVRSPGGKLGWVFLERGCIKNAGLLQYSNGGGCFQHVSGAPLGEASLCSSMPPCLLPSSTCSPRLCRLCASRQTDTLFAFHLFCLRDDPSPLSATLCCAHRGVVTFPASSPHAFLPLIFLSFPFSAATLCPSALGLVFTFIFELSSRSQLTSRT